MLKHHVQKLISRLVTGLVLPLLLCAVSSTAYGQTTISGTVTSDEGDPLIGVTIRAKEDLTTGTITDIDGKYSLTVPSGANVMVLSYTGYRTEEVEINNRTQIDIVMETDSETLEEVVVVGYGYVDKKDLTGAVASVKSEDLTRVQSSSFEQGLAAQASGVQVTGTQGGPGAGSTIRIRGGTSITGSSDPLYVIDGFPLVGANVAGNAGPGSISESPLSTINPEDIESIEILKDASSTAIYGSRGANGVILITTKTGKAGRARLTYNNSFGVGAISKKVDILSPQEYIDFWNEYHAFGVVTFNEQDRAYKDDFGNDLEIGGGQILTRNWADRIFRNSFNMRHNLNLNGGSDRTRYNVSFGYGRDEGILPGSYYDRYSTNLNINQELVNGLSAGINVNAGFVDRGGPVTAAVSGNSTQRSSLLTQILLFPNVQGRIRDREATYDEDGFILSGRNGATFNPERQVATTHNFGNTVNAFGNVYLQYAINDDLSLKTTYGGNFYNNNSEGAYPSDFGWSQAIGGAAFTNLFRAYGWLNENTISYKKDLGNHRFNVVGGFTQQQSTNRNLSTNNQDFPLPGVNIDDLASSRLQNITRSGKSTWGLKSYLGRINYTLNDKYLFTVSGRSDGSSRFAEGNKWGFFPSAAFSWRASEEPFIQNINAISSLKFRATYGVSGNNNIGEYRSLAAFGPTRAIIDGNIASGATQVNPANESLTWETTEQSNFGFELGLFNNRLTLDFDYYLKNTSDLLLNVPSPPESGFSEILQNLGEVENRGIELALSATPVDRGDFSWNIRLNLSRNRNTVKDIGDASEILFNAPGPTNQDFIVRVGDPLGSFYGFETDGIYNYSDFPIFDGLSTQESADLIRNSENAEYWNNFFPLRENTVTRGGVVQYRPGMVKIKDIAGFDENGNRVEGPDGVINSADRTILGSVQPDLFGGFTNDFRYKSFGLNFLWQFSVGNEVYNINRQLGTSTAIPGLNKLGEVADRWTLDDPDSDIPGIWGLTDGGVSSEALSDYIEDGSFLRLANVTLNYDLPRGLLTSNNARVFLAIDNALIFSNYSGYDPEVNVSNNPTTPGIDLDSYPRQRIIRGGFSVTF